MGGHKVIWILGLACGLCTLGTASAWVEGSEPQFQKQDGTTGNPIRALIVPDQTVPQRVILGGDGPYSFIQSPGNPPPQNFFHMTPEGAIAGGCPASDCAGGVLTQSLDPATDAMNQVACGVAGVGTTENGWARCYDLAAEVGGDFQVESVTFGVQQATMDGIQVDVVLYEDTDGCPPADPTTDAVEVARETVFVNIADEGSMITVNFPGAPVFAGALIVEIEQVMDGTEPPEFQFRPMSNDGGECGPSYIRAADCGLPGWVAMGDIGFPDAHLIQIVNGVCVGPPDGCPDPLTQNEDTETDDMNTVACGVAGVGTTENGWARCYDLDAEGVPGGNYVINSVSFGVQQATMDGIQIDVVIYEDTDDCPPVDPTMDAVEIARETVIVNIADEGATLTVPFPGAPSFPASANVIVEIEQVMDGTEPPEFQFRPRSNMAPESGPSYIRADDCGIPGWVALADIGFPDAHLVQVIDGTCEDGPPPPCPEELTQSEDTETDDMNSVACGVAGVGTTENGWARCYDLAAEGVPGGEEYIINSVSFGVQQATMDGIQIDVVIYEDTDGCPPVDPTTDAVEIARETVIVNIADEGATLTVPFPDAPSFPASANIIVEIEQVMDGTEPPEFQFRPRSNMAGETGPSYIRAADCGIPGWVALADIGFPDAHLVQVINGECVEPGPDCPGEGDCCEANGTPGCDDLECCETVCAADPFCCDIEWDSICAEEAFDLCGDLCEIQGSLDIKPGSCPNPLNRSSNGVIPVALVGTDVIDATLVDISSLSISRADGVGGSASPHEGPPGPNTVLEDVATPFDGELCDCHELEGDGITDVSMKFKTQEVVDALELNDLPSGAVVELCVTGNLLDGTALVACDCVTIVPPGAGANAVSVNSNVMGSFVTLTPMDAAIDGDGWTPFARSYFDTTPVSITAPEFSGGRAFFRWVVDGQTLAIGERSIVIEVNGERSLRAIYGRDDKATEPGPPDVPF